jgi:hypothetical protein
LSEKESERVTELRGTKRRNGERKQNGETEETINGKFGGMETAEEVG